jgi:O-antigen/teichoic acid export membrane protein
VTRREGVSHQATHRRPGRRAGRQNCISVPARHRPSRHHVRRRLADKDTLTGRATRALGWSFGSALLTKVSLFGIGVLLARLLGPHAFGTYAVAYVALVALQTFNELGVSLAIVRWPGDPGEIIPTVTTISLSVSAIIYIACFLAAPIYASALGAPAATTVVRVLALAVLSDGFTNTPAAVLQRNFRQGQRTITDQVNVWLGTGVTIALAWSGYGAMSLAIGRLAGCVAGAIMLLAFAPESLRLGFDPAKARALLRFGLPLAGVNILTFAVGSVDQIVVGRVLGPVELGFYVLALNLASWPINMFSQPVRIVGPAVFSRLQHDGAAMRATFLSAARLLGAVALPVCFLIGGAATPLISFVYGARWLPSAQPLLWLALLGGVQVFFLLAYDLFVVLARSRLLLITQMAWLVALVPALAVGARVDGIYGAGLGEFAVAVLCVLPFYLAGLSNEGIRLRTLGLHLRLPLAGAAVAGLLALGAAKVAHSTFTALVASGVATVVVVGLLSFRMRAALALLRASSAGPVVEGSASTVTAVSAADARSPAGKIAEAPSAIRGEIDAPIRHRDLPPELGAYQDASDTPPAYPDLAGALPAYCDILGIPPSRQDLSATSPLYRKTVASLRWDPGQALRPGSSQPDGRNLAEPNEKGISLLI